MWSTEVTGESTASPTKVFAVMVDTRAWSTWNEGVADIALDGPFEAGARAVMVFPDGSALPFDVASVTPGQGFTDVTEIPDAGVVVRVDHEAHAHGTGTRIIYRCTVEGPDDDVAREVGTGVSADFAAVIAALGRRAEELV